MGYSSSIGALVPMQDKPASYKSPIRSAYDAAADTQAGDYDNIMSGYDALQQRARNGSANSPVNYTPLSSVSTKYLPGYNYTRSADFGSTIDKAKGFADTGGFSDGDLQSIRERALSPLRSAYAAAKRNTDRQKVLSGGYAPNAGALQAKMAREQGELASNASTAANAEIAKMVQSGKLSGIQALSPLVSGENNLMNSVGMRNADAEREVEMGNVNDERNVRDLNANMQMRVAEFNANNANKYDDMELSALQGKQSLYGTTPALTNLFGNQVLQNNQQNMQAVQTANQIKNQRANVGLNIVNSAGATGW